MEKPDAEFLAEPEYESDRYQRMLIPVNIVVVILCLTAMFSLLFAPFLTFNMSDAEGALTEFINSAIMGGDPAEGNPEEGTEGGSQSGMRFVTGLDAEDEAQGGAGDEAESEQLPGSTGLFAESLAGVEVSFSTVGLATFAFSSDPTAVLIDGMIGMISSAVERITVEVTVNGMLREFGDGFEADKDRIDVDKLYKKLEALGSDQDKDTAISAFSDELREQLGEDVVTSEWKGKIDDYIGDLYDETVQQAGSFSMEALVCITLTGGEENGSDAPVTYSELFNRMFNDPENESSAALRNNVQNIARIVSYAVFVLLFFAGVWATLAVFAFVHIFTENKRCAMWYVKLFGHIPCLLFWVAPLVAGGLLSGFGGIGALFAAIGSYTWISGACYVALWLVSVFWAHPIKKRLDEAEQF